MPDKEISLKNWNWYKVSTIILSILTVCVLFVSGVYYKSVDESARRADKIQAKIDKLSEQRDKLKKIPKVKVSILSLSNSGLPQTAFNSLAKIPAVLRIKHIEGRTAKNITVSVTSSLEIVEYIEEPSVEKYTLEINKDRKRIVLDIRTLRPGSIVQGTLMCSGVGQFSHTTRIDTGEVISDPEPKEEPKEELDMSIYFSNNRLDSIDPSSLTSTDKIDTTIKSLRYLLNREHDSSPFSGFNNYLKIIFAGFLPAILVIFFIIGRALPKWKKGKKLGDLIGKCKENDLLQPGTDAEEVKKILGYPHDIEFVNSEEGKIEKWSYKTTASPIYGWQPDAYIKIKDSKIVEIEYKEYGQRNYS